MTKDEAIENAIKIIKKHLSKDYKIFLFGSWVKGNALETSDIDIGILGKKEVPWEIMAKILEEVDEIATLRSIDIVDLNAKEEKFRKNVLRYAEVLN